jgi:hypothetical protein
MVWSGAEPVVTTVHDDDDDDDENFCLVCWAKFEDAEDKAWIPCG